MPSRKVPPSTTLGPMVGGGARWRRLGPNSEKEARGQAVRKRMAHSVWSSSCPCTQQVPVVESSVGRDVVMWGAMRSREVDSC